MVKQALKPNRSITLYSARLVDKLHSMNNKIYGLLGRGIPETVNTASLDLGNLKGQLGETVIGSMLNILALENDELYVFHSITAPGNKRGETDHIVLYKNKLILIETKTYGRFHSFKISKEGELNGRYTDDKNRKVYRKLDNNNLIEKVEIYQSMFPEYAVHAITAITRSNINTSSENGKYKVASLANVLEDIGYHLDQATSTNADLNDEAIKYLASQCLNK